MGRLAWIEKLMVLDIGGGQQRKEGWGWGRILSALLSVRNEAFLLGIFQEGWRSEQGGAASGQWAGEGQEFC